MHIRYMTACFFTTLACQLEVIAPLNLYFNWKQVVEDGQFWRMLTNFLYFGNFGIDYLFHMFFLVRYSTACFHVCVCVCICMV